MTLAILSHTFANGLVLVAEPRRNVESAAFTSVKRFIGRKRKAISRPQEHQVRSISFAQKPLSLFFHMA